MNKKIIAILHPFEYKHFIYVYQDGNKIDMAKVLIDDVPDNIITFAEKYKINKIKLISSNDKEYSYSVEDGSFTVNMGRNNTLIVIEDDK